MNNSKSCINIYIASDIYFIRSGIRGLIREMLNDANFISITQLLEMQQHNHCSSDFLIIHNKLITKPRAKHYNDIKALFKGKTMVISDNDDDITYFDYRINLSSSKLEINRQLDAFFQIETTANTAKNSVLSARETDVLKEVAMGYSNKEIADRLFISINTVITHRKNITEKLGIKTISGLTVYALLNQLITPENVNA
jgi:DNA-binding CsgD family transcriptional regulator